MPEQAYDCGSVPAPFLRVHGEILVVHSRNLELVLEIFSVS